MNRVSSQPTPTSPASRLLGVVSWLGLALFFASCSVTKPVEDRVTRHLLKPTVQELEQNRSQPRLAVARPSLPAYLDGMSMVNRDASGGIQNHRQHLWAEPLDVNMARVLASNLSRLTRSANVKPADSFVTADYAHLLEVRVQQFDQDQSGLMVLVCDWTLQPLVGSTAPSRSFRTGVPLRGGMDAMDARVAAMNEALARLAMDIAAGLR